jgi:long-chain acyl-CoA synthetase
VVARYQEEIDFYNEGFGHIEKIKQFRLLPKQWTIESGEMTPTMKIKRKVVAEKFKTEIASFYS